MEEILKVFVLRLPKCAVCCATALYEAKTIYGSWAFLCEQHFAEKGVGLGAEKGHRLTVMSEKEEVKINKKRHFYRCVTHDTVDGKPQVVALKTKGYSDGEIGLHKENGIWIATHIPTGLQFPPHRLNNKNARDTLAEAKQLITEGSEYTFKLQKHMYSDTYAKFLKSKAAQIRAELF